MKIYFFTNVNNPNQLLNFQEVNDLLNKNGVTVYNNMKPRSDLELDEQGSVESIDAVIIDGSSAEAEAGYLLAVALAHKKPVLYLVPAGSVIESSVKALLNNKEISKYLQISYYSGHTAAAKVKEFMQFLDQDMGREAYSVKFTLRLTPRLERYLTWKADIIGKNKADYVRTYLEGLMKSDDEFKHRLQ